MEQLRNKLATSDIDNVKQDVLPYISHEQPSRTRHMVERLLPAVGKYDKI